MAPTKAFGDDGFPTLFFQNYWNIVDSDVTKFCLKVLNNGMDFDEINFTNIVFIPKIPHPTNLFNFLRISLYNVLYKLIAKMIVNRFKKVLNTCLDESQSAFVPNRLIFDNMLFAYETLHTFHQKRVRKKGFMVLKLYLSKAYDRVE